jgi:hypothetical protein
MCGELRDFNVTNKKRQANYLPSLRDRKMLVKLNIMAISTLHVWRGNLWKLFSQKVNEFHPFHEK